MPVTTLGWWRIRYLIIDPKGQFSFSFPSLAAPTLGNNTQCHGETWHIRTWGYRFHCSPVSSQFVFQHRPVCQHSSHLCWWLWQRWLGRLAAGRPSTMDYPHGQQCGYRTHGCSVSSVSHQWLWRRQQKGGLMTGWHCLSVPHWDRGTLERIAQRDEMNASLKSTVMIVVLLNLFAH